MQAALLATDAHKREALRVLRGDAAEPEKRQETEPYLTLREVGRRLGVSPCSLWRWGVPGHDLGGRRRFRMREVEAYLAGDEFKRRAADLKEDRADARKEVTGKAEG
jgi:hypothetical protein